MNKKSKANELSAPALLTTSSTEQELLNQPLIPSPIQQAIQPPLHQCPVSISRLIKTRSLVQRLDKWLANLGYCTRANASNWLKGHKLSDDQGRPLKQVSEKVSSSFLIDGQPLDHPGPLFILLYKPAGYVCSHAIEEGVNVYSLLPERWQRRHPSLQTIGRLDKDTTGLLLITDQSQWVHQLTHPKKAIFKRYRIEYKGELPSNSIDALARGELLLSGEKEPCLPATLKLLEDASYKNSERANGRATLEICEGRYHQVKRMFAALGCEVIKLHRESFGPLDLDQLEEGVLAEGQWREIDPLLFELREGK